MPQLSRDARQHRAAQRVILIVSDDLVELRDPSEDPRRQDVGTPRDAMPAAVLAKPALHQVAGRIARGSAGSEVGDPAKAVPGGHPFLTDRRRAPAWRGIADQLSTQLDFAASDRRPTFRVARPTQTDAQSQVVGNRADQRMAIKRAGGKRLKSLAAQPRHPREGVSSEIPASRSDLVG